MAVMKSVEYVEVTITASSEPVVVNLTKGQDETKCTPRFTARPTTSVTDQHQDRMAEVEIIDNAGTPAVRVSASAMVRTEDVIYQIWIIEWGAAITVQQVDVSSFTGTSLNVAVADVGNQTTAFFHYSYQFTSPPSSDDDFNDLLVQARWNGAATDSITLTRRASGGTVDGTLYVIECNATEFVVEHLEIDVTTASATSDNTAAATTVMADTFLLHSYETSETGDDLLDAAWRAWLNSTTRVDIGRTQGGATPDATSTHSIQVVECQNNEWDVQRENSEQVSGATEKNVTITAVDRTRSFVQSLHCDGATPMPATNTITGSNVGGLMYGLALTADNNLQIKRQATNWGAARFSWEVVQFAVVILDIAPSGLATAEAHGATVISVGAVDIAPDGTASAEAHGATVISVGAVSVAPSGLATVESHGATVIAVGAVDISPSGLASGEALGTSVIAVGAVDLSPSSLASAEAFGTSVITLDISVSGIASVEALGAMVLAVGAVDISVAAIASLEAHGAAVLAVGAVDISVTGIASLEAIGAAVLLGAIAPDSINSAQAFGTTAIVTGSVNVAPAGIASPEAFGTAVLTLDISIIGIPAAEAFGSVSLSTGSVDITPPSVSSVEAFGTAVLTLDIAISGMPTAEAFGSASADPGAVDISPASIAGAEAHGATVLTTGQVNVAPAGIAPLESFGTAVLTLDISISGIPSDEAFGTMVLAVGLVDVTPSSMGSIEAFGATVVTTAAADVSPTGIASLEDFGVVSVLRAGEDHVFQQGRRHIAAFIQDTIS